ncbi:hypothetical protein [Rhodococcus sp. AG1013]|uniref:hypothetical protein n=1 Tax=unclassified Rhodococcus (in: high G+C Gram-positive bacteria) TaxID=192944 RepID=UPI000E0CAD35|nr:hypothetical protein [Rhodococcus sp. AG1013]RDI35550.1 hypothetical protein DEU38_10126 [Rhodococcus sp. AG1013]
MNIIDRLISNHPNLHGHPCTTHGEDGAVYYTQWSVWFHNESTAVRPQDIPELIESLRVMHAKWLAATSVRAAA